MPDPGPQDKAFEAALSKSLRTQRSADEGCPDPEVLAAYWERPLASEERTKCEAHFASFLRCQAQLAALARTSASEEPTVHTSVGLGWLLDWRWLTLAATVAVVMLAVWVIEPGAPADRQTPTVADTQMADPAQEGLAERPETESIDARQRRDAAAPPRERSVERELAPTNELAELVSEEATVAALPAQTERRENAGLGLDALAADEDLSFQQLSLEQQSADTRVAPAMPIDVQRPTEPELADAPTERRLVAESSAAREAPASATARLADADIGTVIATPDTASFWRLPPGGGIEHSTDGGSTWVVQLTGANVELTAGVSPAPSICWVAGRTGTILRTIDGETWEPISPKISADLVMVEASDGVRATVTATDGTRYRTADGRETWSAL